MTLMNDTQLDIAGRMKAARLLKGMEQSQVAELLGVARTTVSAWERGASEPSATNFVRWAMITGQPLEWLAGGVVRLEGLEPPTFWLGVAWSRFRQRFARSDAFWTPERRSILADLARQVQPDSEIPTGSGSAR